MDIALCNDYVTGIMGEKVLWNFLLESFPNMVGVDYRVIEPGEYASSAKNYINQYYPEVKIILQNATFINTVDSSRFTISFLQDNLRAMGRYDIQQEQNLKLANLCVTNSEVTAASYPEFNFKIIPVGVDSNLFHPINKEQCKKEFDFSFAKIGIFVGDFSEVKGWQEVHNCIVNHSDIFWILVTKNQDTISLPNSIVYNQVPQNILVQLLNCADFFILGSPVETQCLAAIEACLCNIPIVMHNTGIFHDLSTRDRQEIGYFGENLLEGINYIYNNKFSPREMAIKQKWTVKDSMDKWHYLIDALI